MKPLVVAALALMSAPALAQDAHAGHAGHAAAPAAAAATRLNLDTPIETIFADAAGKAVLDQHLPGMQAHPQYEQAKALSLRQVAAFAPDHITAELLAKIEPALAAIK
jgi:hypothetical protein